MKILFITQWFQPEFVIKGLPFARKLVARGHDVQVLTGFPNYPSGKIYDGYRLAWRQQEIMDGVKVTRVPLYANHDNSRLRRAANYVSFSLAASTIGALSIDKADIAYVYHPPGTIGLPANVIKLLRKIPFVLDIEDLWPDTLPATGMFTNRFGLSLVDYWCRYVYRTASRISVLSPGFKRILMERGVPEDKIDVNYNWSDDDNISPQEPDAKLKTQLGMSGKFNVLFAGNIGKAQALDSVLEAAALVETTAPQVQFVIVGEGIERVHLQQKAKDRELGNVIFLGARPSTEIGQVMSLADVLLVHLKNDPLFEITIPSKTQAYMAMGKPVLMALNGDAAELVKTAHAGVSCPPENPQRLADAVLELVNLPLLHLVKMGENGRKYYWRELSLDVGVAKFEQTFLRAIETS